MKESSTVQIGSSATKSPPYRAYLGKLDLPLRALAGIIYVLAIAGCVRNSSLSTDEAFSAYIACHADLRSLLATLGHGDSSDLQAWMHYIYLHFWQRSFGWSEIALRRSNIPFIALFTAALIWVSRRVFQSGWVWIVPGLLPFFWLYAGQARGYMAVASLAMLSYSALLAYLNNPSQTERITLPWIVLGSLLIGAAFHMLTLLAVAPMLVLIVTNAKKAEKQFNIQDWRAPAAVLFLPAICLTGYLIWTFGRGTQYGYVRPSFHGMLTVLFQFFGGSGYRSSEKYPPGLSRELLTLAFGSVLISNALFALTVSGLHRRRVGLFMAAAAALFVGLIQTVGLSFITQQQVDVRHIAALTPLLPLCVMAGTANVTGPQRVAWGNLALFLLLIGWGISDYRLMFLPEYRVEDYRGIIANAIQLHKTSGAELVLLIDPIASAYYSLAVQGDQPCFPLTVSCETGLKQVSWPQIVPATYGLGWDSGRVNTWLHEHKQRGVYTLVVDSPWHPTYEQSSWLRTVQDPKSVVQATTHGFYIYQVK